MFWCGSMALVEFPLKVESFRRLEAEPSFLLTTGIPPAALRHNADKDGAKEKTVADALDAAPHVIRGAKYRIGSQFHFYMEPQARTTLGSWVRLGSRLC